MLHLNLEMIFSSSEYDIFSHKLSHAVLLLSPCCCVVQDSVSVWAGCVSHRLWWLDTSPCCSTLGSGGGLSRSGWAAVQYGGPQQRGEAQNIVKAFYLLLHLTYMFSPFFHLTFIVSFTQNLVCYRGTSYYESNMFFIFVFNFIFVMFLSLKWTL